MPIKRDRQKYDHTGKVPFHLLYFIDTTGSISLTLALFCRDLAGLKQQSTVRLIRSTEGFPLRRWTVSTRVSCDVCSWSSWVASKYCNPLRSRNLYDKNVFGYVFQSNTHKILYYICQKLFHCPTFLIFTVWNTDESRLQLHIDTFLSFMAQSHWMRSKPIPCIHIIGELCECKHFNGVPSQLLESLSVSDLGFSVNEPLSP